MSALRELQRGFQAYVLGEADTIAARVTGSAAGSAEQRLRIYANAIALRFIEVLGEEFPGLRALLGDDAFARLGHAYAAACPSRHRSIRWFGRDLPSYLKRAKPWSEQALLAEMAEFEWLKSELVDAADSAVIEVADIAALPVEGWAAMRPRPVSAHRRADLHFDVPVLWRALDAGDALPRAARTDPPIRWLLWRNGLVVHWRSIEADEAWALAACAAGASFAEVCAGLCRWTGEDGAPLRAASLLKQWASDALLRAI